MVLVAPLPGTVSEVKAKKGDTVAAGDVVLVIESMKVEIPIKSNAAGRLKEFRVKEGDQIQRNAVLAIVEA